MIFPNRSTANCVPGLRDVARRCALLTIACCLAGSLAACGTSYETRRARDLDEVAYMKSSAAEMHAEMLRVSGDDQSDRAEADALYQEQLVKIDRWWEERVQSNHRPISQNR